MTSIHLRIRKTDKEIIDIASKSLDNEWYVVPLYLKRVSDGLFAEYSYEDLPEQVKTQLDKPEKIY